MRKIPLIDFIILIPILELTISAVGRAGWIDDVSGGTDFEEFGCVGAAGGIWGWFEVEEVGVVAGDWDVVEDVGYEAFE